MPSFGPVVFFGMGGVFIEIFRDVAAALCPTTPHEVRIKLEKPRSTAMLKGYRGQGAYDVDAFVDCVVRVSHLMSSFPAIGELDVNLCEAAGRRKRHPCPGCPHEGSRSMKRSGDSPGRP
ncbi:MAG: acetate--CoA ligase family protein [Rhodopseudomonas palustris]|nr:acetate--CoA ligase family protein [Rhodopseudomonas palustris]